MTLQKSLLIFSVMIFFWCLPNTAVAHDIPTKVTLHIYVKPSGNQLQVLMRVPMKALSEIDFPKRGPGYLDFSLADKAIHDAAEMYLTNSFEMLENEKPLDSHQVQAVRIDLPSDRSFSTFDEAIENIKSPALNDSTDLYWEQGVLDVLVSYPIESETSQFAFISSLDRLGDETNTVLRFVMPNDTERVFNYFGNPGKVELDPSFFSAFYKFIVLGFEHILDGLDHLLFLFCLIIPLRKFRSLIPVITAFTVAHSITLISTLFGIVPNVIWFAPLIETLIALSILYMACENILGVSLKNRWMLTFGFGLIHGFGFSFVLADTMQFAGSHLVSSLLAFNIGVELGQLFVLAIALPILMVFFKLISKGEQVSEERKVSMERLGIILLSAFVAHQALHWMMDRGAAFFAYSFELPTVDLLFWVALMRWGMLLLVIGIVGTLLFSIFKRFLSVENGNEKTSNGF